MVEVVARHAPERPRPVGSSAWLTVKGRSAGVTGVVDSMDAYMRRGARGGWYADEPPATKPPSSSSSAAGGGGGGDAGGGSYEVGGASLGGRGVSRSAAAAARRLGERCAEAERHAARNAQAS